MINISGLIFLRTSQSASSYRIILSNINIYHYIYIMFIIGDKVKFIMGGLTFISIITHKSEKLYNIKVIDVKINENYPKTNWTDEMLEKTKRNNSKFLNVCEENLKLFEDEFNNKFKKFTITI